jgi:FtsH-binding integral membrane protein
VSHYSDSRNDAQDRDQATVPRLMDLRTIIGAVFTIYGIVLVITGLVDKASDLTKANGIRINLWLGLAMLVLGLLFLLWVRLRPLRMEGRSAAARGTESGPPRAD